MTDGPAIRRLFSPVAETHSTWRLSAERPPSLVDARVGLVDEMQNPRGMWGQGILDMAERALTLACPSVACERIDRSPGGGGSPDAWAEAMADRFAALVIAAGD